jgi:RimJ/RimL family protein N-acetyltransferase
MLAPRLRSHNPGTVHSRDIRAHSDLELLEIEMDLLWGMEPGPELVVACAPDGVRVRLGERLPQEIAEALSAEIDSALPLAECDTPPPELERWRTLLEDALGGAVRLALGSGPSYVVHPEVTFQSTAELVRSDSADRAAFRAANPGNWGADEWQDLLDGHLGPWVMARHAERVISICHTPVSNSIAAEAGVWTHPDFRGHGHAAATTAAWATLMQPTGRVLFYSTSLTNRSSQRVAGRLGLRRIGYLWQLQSMTHGAG